MLALALWESRHHHFLALPETLNTSYGFVAEHQQ
jgi:hypothetical protein